jgi:hypothetical protein
VAEEEHLSIEERRENLMKVGWKPFLPHILYSKGNTSHDAWAHVCDPLVGKWRNGGYLIDGVCNGCGFVVDEETQLMMKLWSFNHG